MSIKAAKDNGLAELERRLWAAADQLWANSDLRPAEYSAPVLGLIFLRFADNAFARVEADLKGKATGRRTIGKTDYQARGVVYLPDDARFSKLLLLPESADLGKPRPFGVSPKSMQSIFASEELRGLRSSSLRDNRNLVLQKQISFSQDTSGMNINDMIPAQ